MQLLILEPEENTVKFGWLKEMSVHLSVSGFYAIIINISSENNIKMVKKILCIAAFMFLIIACSSQSVNSQTKTIFVSPKGSDDNSGRSIDKPLITINNAIDIATAGDTICLLPGTYSQTISVQDKSGDVDKPIYMVGYSDNVDEYPVIDGGILKPTPESESFWIILKDSRWFEFDMIKFVNGWIDPIAITNSSYITFRKCNFFGAKHVIWAKGEQTHHILIENCFWDQGGEYLWTLKEDEEGVDAWTSMHHGSMVYFNGSIIDFRGTGGSVVIRNNKIQNAFNAVRWRGKEGGYDSNVEIYGNHISQVRDNDFEPETYTYNLHIYHNILHNVHRTLSIDNVYGGFIYFYGNVITVDDDPWTREVCKNLWKVYGAARNLDFPLYMFNNSFYGYLNAFRVDVGTAIRTKHFNNAYYFTRDGGWIFDIWDSTDVLDYDISNKVWAKNIIDNKQEEHGQITDIKYVDTSKYNLKLQPSSPGIDAGKVMNFTELDWRQSYDGKAPDVGAYENGNLVEGPPFRFRIPPDANLSYKEKPRIVRYKIEGNKLILFFSDKIDTSVSKENIISVYQGEQNIQVKSVSFNNNYKLVVNTYSSLSKDDLSIKFNSIPKGLNGEIATYWASAIKIKK